ncbi:MAG TPA: YeeE/YedE family protein [Pseudohongiella sp.]|nr:YeeE/YedE family protein [Pseudohongiella sp.]HEA63236.1 YeeE/YedE family protein [Pseudohongiella sp.]
MRIITLKTHFITAFITGLVFGLGLLISGMANPDKVLSFLDLAGAWDPSLALVMLGAIAVGIIAFGFIKGRSQSLLGEPLRLPGKTTLDSRLITGSLGFGIGWGLAGFCPGPALVALGAGEAKAAVFVAAMLAGMGLFELIEKRRPASR